MSNPITDALPDRFFIDTLKISTYEDFFKLEPVCEYWWEHKEETEPWPTVKLQQRTAVRLWDGRTRVLYRGDYLVWCNSNPVQIGYVSYIAHEMGNYKTRRVQDIAGTLNPELLLAWANARKLATEQRA